MDPLASNAVHRIPGRVRGLLGGGAGFVVSAAVVVLARGAQLGNPDLGFGLLVVGWALAGIAVVGVWPATEWWGERQRSLVASARRHRMMTLLASAVLVIAAAARIAPLGSIPPPDIAWYEELQTGEIAYQILVDGHRPLDYPLINYGVSLSFRCFGMSTVSLRVVTILLGWLTIPLFLATALQLFKPVPAVFVTALFAVSRWHIHVNHIADENAPPLVLMMAILALVTSSPARPGAARLYLLGSLLGLTLYVYPGYRFLLALAPLVIIGRWHSSQVRGERPPGGGSSPLGIAVVGLLVSAAIVATPLVEAALLRDHRAYILTDIRRDKLFSLPGHGETDWRRTGELTETVLRSIFTDRSCEWVSAGGRPALEPVAASLGIVGWIWALATPRRRGRAMLAVWTPLVAYVGTVAMGATYLHRLCAIIPMLYLLMGVPIDGVWRWVSQPRLRRFRVVATVVLVGAFAVETHANLRTLLVDYPADPRVRAHFEDLSRELPIRARELAESSEVDVYLWSDIWDPVHYYRRSETTWLTGTLRGRPMLGPFDVLPIRGERAGNDALIGLRLLRNPTIPLRADMMASFYYPEILDGRVHNVSPLGRIDTLYYRLPDVMVNAHRGLLGRYFEPAATLEDAVLARVDRLDGTLPLDIDTDDPALVGVWTGWAWVDVGDEYTVEVAGCGPTWLWLNGLPVVDGQPGGRSSARVLLDRGWHVVELRVDGTSRAAPPRLLIGRAGHEPAPFPVGDLFATDRITGFVRALIGQSDGVKRVLERRIVPAITSHAAIPLATQVRLEHDGAELVGVRWEGWIELESDTRLSLSMRVRQGVARLEIDGEAVAVVPPDGATHDVQRTVEVAVSQGSRRLVVTFDAVEHDQFLGGVDLTWSEGGATGRLWSLDSVRPIPPDVSSMRPRG